MITEAETRWRNQVLPELQTSPSLQARIQQDPILREALKVLTAEQREAAVAAAERLRSRWFPFHGLNEIGERRRKWLGDLQEATAAEARDAGVSEERVKTLLNEQAVWLAVIRSPMKSTAPQVWKEAQQRWIQEYKSDVLTEVSGGATRRRRGAQPMEFEPPSPERFFAETRLLAIESLNTVWLCEKVGTQLSDAQKNVLRLTYVTGLMEDHIADQMGLSIDAVGKLKRNAMAVLRAALG